MPSIPLNMLTLTGMLAGLSFMLAASIGTTGAETGSIAIENAWARATPAGAKVAAGYLTVKNGGDEPDRLVSARAEFAGTTEIHTVNMVDGVMQMRPVKDGLAVPAQGSVALEPNSYHLMFMDLAKPLAEGDIVSGELTFARAGSVPVEFKVMGIGAAGPDAKTQHQHHHH